MSRATPPGWRYLEVNGGVVAPGAAGELALRLPPIAAGYADAQIDDYGRLPRRVYPHGPGVELRLEARFSHGPDDLVGTAGFGFWNAPFSDPTVRWPALPRAAWFFLASPPSDLPLAVEPPGRGWFAATIDASARSLPLAPLAPALAVAWRLGRGRELWRWVRERLGIAFAPLAVDPTVWHTYTLRWRRAGCVFAVDGREALVTARGPGGRLGFVCWVDNQYLVARPDGRFGWGVLPTTATQTLAIRGLEIGPAGG